MLSFPVLCFALLRSASLGFGVDGGLGGIAMHAAARFAVVRLASLPLSCTLNLSRGARDA